MMFTTSRFNTKGISAILNASNLVARTVNSPSPPDCLTLNLLSMCVLVAEWLAFGTASLTARVWSCGLEVYKRFDSSARTPGSEPSIIGGLVYRESHPWALKGSLDAYGELQVPITNKANKSHTMLSSHIIVGGWSARWHHTTYTLWCTLPN